MLQFLIRRVIWVIPVVVAVATVTFFLMNRAPGGPWDREKALPPATVQALNQKFGLDKPQWANPGEVAERWQAGERNPLALAGSFTDSRYFTYMFGVFRGDLGPSYASKGSQSVQEIIAQKFPVSLKIGIVALIFAVVVGIPLGVVSSLRQNSLLDYVCLTLSTLGVAVPSFVSGLLILLFVTRQFGYSPVREPSDWEGFGQAFILPGIVLGLGTMSYILRLTRSAMLETKAQDFVRTARAKGLSGSAVVNHHMLRNAMIPVATVLGPAAADLVTGSIIIETIYGAPGLGNYFVTSIGKRDYSMIMGTAIFYALLIALANVLVDVSYGLIDPRIRTSR